MQTKKLSLWTFGVAVCVLFCADHARAQSVCSDTGGLGTLNRYVDPNGVDVETGGSIGAPWRTIEFAVQAVRGLNLPSSPPNMHICVYLREGTGPIKEFKPAAPIVLGPLDSGQNGYKIVYRAYAQERPAISGGRSIGPWSLVGANYQANVDLNGAQPFGGPFRQFYVNGVRAVRARKPNLGEVTSVAEQLRGFYREHDWLPGFLAPLDPNTALCQPVPPTAAKVVRIQPGHASGVTAYNDQAGNRPEMLVQMQWLTNVFRVGQVTPNGDGFLHVQLGSGSCSNCANPTFERDVLFENFTYQSNSYGIWCYPGRNPKSSYHWENVESFLDEEGEWYLRYLNDGSPATDFVLYRLRANQTPAMLDTAVAPRLTSLFRIDGGAGVVSNVELRGLTLEYTGWVDPHTHGYVETGGTAFYRPMDVYPLGTTYPWPLGRIPAAIHVRRADSIQLVGNTLRHLGGVGIDLEDGVSSSGVIGNVIEDVSGSGIALGPGNRFFPPIATALSDVTVTDNLIKDVGLDYQAGNGILLTHAQNSLVANNEIWGVRYGGMNVGWGLTGATVLPGVTVRNNRIRHALELLVDNAGIYNAGKWANPPTVIRDNYIHDLVRSRAAAFPISPETCSSIYPHSPVVAIYLDQGSDQVEVIDNAIINANSCAGGPPETTDPPMCTTSGTSSQPGVFLQPYFGGVGDVCAEGNEFAYGSMKLGAGVLAQLYVGAVPQRTPGSFVTGLGYRTPRNDHGGAVGYWIGTGARPLVVRKIGRLQLRGNTGSHMLRITRLPNVEVAAVSIDMSAGQPDALGFKYVNLPQPVVLEPGQQYRITSDETVGGDYWYELDTTFRTEGDRAINGPTYRPASGSWVDLNLPGQAYGAVNIVYDGVKLVSRVVNEGDVRADGGTAGMKLAVATQDLSVFKLGRYAAKGNDEAHTLWLYRAGESTPFLSSLLTMGGTGTDEEGFKYVPITTPLRLRRSQIYYFGSAETPTDLWFDWETQVIRTRDAVVSPAYWNGASWVDVFNLPGQSNSYGPLNVVYEPLDRMIFCIGSPPAACVTPGSPATLGGLAGMRITVPTGKTITVTELGRYFHAGNTGTRIVRIYSLGGSVLTQATVAVAGAPSTSYEDGFNYAALANPLTLTAGDYYVASEEVPGQAFGDYTTLVQHGSGVSVVKPVYWNGTVWTTVESPQHAYGPLNLIYYSKSVSN